MDNNKKYGNITVGSLHYLVECLTELEHFKAGRREFHQKTHDDKKERILGNNFSWVRLYRFPFYNNLLTFKIISRFNGIAKKDLKQNPVTLIEEVLFELKSLIEFTGGQSGIFKKKHLLKHIYPLINSVTAISLYGTTMNRLMKRATEDDDKAFFQAVRVDRSVISYKGMTSRIARAEIEEDEDFFNNLRNALTAKIGNLADYSALRFILIVLHEHNALEDISQKDAYELLAKELHLYPQTGENPVSSLWQYIDRWKKDIDVDMEN